MTLEGHWLALPSGGWLNLARVERVSPHHAGGLNVWYGGEEPADIFTGDDVDTISRRLGAVALVATSAVEGELASMPMPPGVKRPKP